MINFEYIVRISRRLKGDRGEGQRVAVWFIRQEATAKELVAFLNSKTPGGRPIEL